jgi:hypothetical protein
MDGECLLTSHVLGTTQNCINTRFLALMILTVGPLRNHKANLHPTQVRVHEIWYLTCLHVAPNIIPIWPDYLNIGILEYSNNHNLHLCWSYIIFAGCPFWKYHMTLHIAYPHSVRYARLWGQVCIIHGQVRSCHCIILDSVMPSRQWVPWMILIWILDQSYQLCTQKLGQY